MLKYLRESFRRKKARRITQEYAPLIKTYQLEKEGAVEFANWDNPLVEKHTISQVDVDFFKKFIKKGDLIVDIGANSGAVTVPMSLAAGKEGVTLGFDPNPYVFKILATNASLNKEKTNIVAVPCAIAATESEYYYTSSEASFANGGISETNDNRHGKFVYPEQIKGVNLHEYIQENYAGKQVTFVKVDAEGYDKEIIKSIGDLISAHKPVMVAESFGSSSDDAKKELFEVIAQHNYQIFYFEDFKSDAETIEVKNAEEMLKWKETINIYAVPR